MRVGPLAVLILVGMGGLWLLIWRGGVRVWGALPILAGILLALSAPRPDVLIAADARSVAIRGGDGRLYFPLLPRDRYAAGRWLLREGDARTWRDAVDRGSVSRDGLGWVARQLVY